MNLEKAAYSTPVISTTVVLHITIRISGSLAQRPSEGESCKFGSPCTRTDFDARSSSLQPQTTTPEADLEVRLSNAASKYILIIGAPYGEFPRLFSLPDLTVSIVHFSKRDL
ncbi:Structural maintenance of chromosomes 4 [Gossypium arboreum]|uniref:Structural maintenance of chromosomes 4 n=1 Tax=Gossypium arboreum TaxID=29729 RepID=A0A0B0P1A7_GOSAR|nr:Structural maintenance of chromosomes 4 [Gossypium arboreum]